MAGRQDMLSGTLADLVATLTDTVSGYTALQLTLVHTGHPVRLTAVSTPDGSYVDDGHPHANDSLDGSRDSTRIVSSLRLPLPLVSPSFEEGSRLVVWSAVAGSLVDLAADLAYVFRPADTPNPADRAGPVVLDADLPPPPAMTSGVAGLTELATIHRAAGLLIDQGHHPDTVHTTLRRDAAAAGLSTHAFAARLLRR